MLGTLRIRPIMANIFNEDAADNLVTNRELYVEIQVENVLFKTTPSRGMGSHFVWNEEIQIFVYHLDTLRVSVRDSREDGNEAIIGEASVRMGEVCRKDTMFQAFFQLHNSVLDNIVGDIHIRINWTSQNAMLT